MRKSLLIFILLGSLLACNTREKQREQAPKKAQNSSKTQVKYAKGFTVKYENGAKWVEVPKPYKNATEGFSYLLVQKGQEVPDHDASVQVVEIPIERIVCTSTTHIPLLDYIDETEALVGFPTVDFISSKKMRSRIDSGHVTDVGIDKEMNLELLLDVNPEMVMAYTLSNDFGQFRQIQNAGIPVIINAEYIEPHPLGRAEWIKFMALFFNKEETADSVFTQIETKYNTLKSKAEKLVNKPSIMSGVIYGDTWYLPSGNNYAAKILRDAGGDYLWAEDSSSVFLELSFEAVYDKAHDADYWIGVGSYESLESIKAADERYTEFKAFKEGNIISYNARKGAKGGSEFLELGYLRPDLILSDLVKVLHPELMDDEDLFFHERLE